MEDFEVPIDAPLDIQQKATQMRRCWEQIQALTGQLKAAESLWNSLRDEVAGYIQQSERKRLISARPAKVSLDGLPNELLFNIFRHLRFERYGHLGALLLINKRIHHFVMSTPLLWTHIEVLVDCDLLDATPPKPSYVEACLKNSQSAGLDIEIHLEWDAAAEFLKQAAIVAVVNLVDEQEEDAVWSTLNDIDMDFRCPVYEKKEAALFEVLDAIIGTDGCNMRRWKSLVLSLPSDPSHRIAILERLIGSTPNLCEVDLQNTDGSDSEQDAWDSIFQDLSSLSCFTSDYRLPWAFSALNPNRISELKIDLRNSMDFEILASYRALQHLDIYWEGKGDSSNSIILLPNLRSLHIRGPYNYILNRLLTPLLDKLSISSFTFRLPWEVPLLTATVVQWHCRHFPDGINASVSFLQQIFSSLRRTQQLILSGFAAEAVMDAFQVFKRSNSFPEELQVILLRRWMNTPDTPLLELRRKDFVE
ncbi:SubName: Full=Uncharacterized protein {ECO:0000313/EMBL:CCA73500.1} [Serendipita indica DSM 11827]|nr:SubName: Full=Uncharacterized protein {ECO:0000313/EMBL:CCA73500.1} [Serendipita indica DSM 11827]